MVEGNGKLVDASGTAIRETSGHVQSRLPRIAVGFPCGGSIVDSGFAETFSGALVGHGELFWAEQAWVHGGIPDDSRNTIVKSVRAKDYDYVFFQDVDMTFPKGALAKLVRTMAEIAMSDKKWADVPTVVGGLYVTRSDHRQNSYDWDEAENSFVVNPVEPFSGWHKRDFVATGCMLIDAGVFEQMEFPWFEYWYKERKPGEGKQKWSEDAVFAKKCYDLGIPHFVDSDVVCGHIHTVVIEPVSRLEYTVKGMSGMVYPEVGVAR